MQAPSTRDALAWNGTPTLAELVASLTEAREAGILDEQRSPRLSFTFHHALFQEAFRYELPPVLRMRLHSLTASALASNVADRGAHLAEIAHHSYQAAPIVGADTAVHFAVEAGDQAMRILGFEDAAVHYTRALELLAHDGADLQRRCDIQLHLGDAQRRAGSGSDGREVFRQAAGVARQLEDATLLARAALGLARTEENGAVDSERIAILEEALRALGPQDSVWRARLLGRLAMANYFQPGRGRSDDLSAEAVTVARRLDDPGAVVATLLARHFCIWHPDSLSERLQVAGDAVRMAEEIGDRDQATEGRIWLVVDLIEAGEFLRFEHEWRVLHAGNDMRRLPSHRWHHHLFCAMRALAGGRSDEAQQESGTALQVGEEGRVARAGQFFGVQLFYLRRQQGRLEELEETLRGFSEQFAALPIWRCGLALLYSEIGREDEARQIFEALAADDFGAVPRDGNWMPAMANLAEVGSRLGDRSRSQVLYDQLAPYAGGQVVIADAVAYLGPVHYFLGILAAVGGQGAAARSHLQTAAREAERFAAPALVARIESRIGNMADNTRAGDPRLDSLAPRAAGHAVFRCEADYWIVAFADRTVRLRHSRGLFYLQLLLRNPDFGLGCLDLVAAAHADPSTSAQARPAIEADLPRGHAAAAGASLLDGRAKAAYRARIASLQEDLADAESQHDLGRAEVMRTEIDAITDELARAVGRGGRDRQFANDVERARVAVTKAILLVYKKLDRQHPELHTHLTRTIRTGQICSYTPARDRPVAWEF